MNQGKKKKWILLLVGGVIAILVIAVVVLSKKNETYRLIKVESYEGNVTLQRDATDEKLFEGIHLKSGDVVNTGEESNTLLLADDDKHLLAEENTCFSIEAVGNKEKGGITINLEYGSALITIDKKLNSESSFELNTPNATLSVRGTIFRVTYDKTMMYTIVEIREGIVEIASETGVIMGGAGETYSVDAQGIIQAGTPDEETGANGEAGSNGDVEIEAGGDIAELPDNGLLEPVTITQQEFELNYMEDR
ncbi:MAG: FecR domain-containing protein, partial [Wujia sp.]